MIKGVLQGQRQLRASINTGSLGIKGGLTVPKTIDFQDNYEKLKNLPQIESVQLVGNKTFNELGMQECSNQDILDMFK